MKKNRSPLFIIIAISCLISLLSVSIYGTFEYMMTSLSSLQKYFILFGFICLISIVIVQYFIKNYISKKINPLYNLVGKKPGKIGFTEEVDLKTDVFGKLNGEVKLWMDNKNLEIKAIKDLEQYRKDYMGNISHELKTPLTSVQGYIHTLLEDVEDETIRRKFLQKAANNTERLIQIVNDLELITKIEAEINDIKYEAFDLRSLATEIIDDLSFMTHEKNIEIKFIDGSMSSYMANGDEEGIRRVLNNLLVNSIKYGKQHGLSTLKFYDMADTFLIEVIDNGIGIDKEHLPHIFDRFYRTDKSRNRKIGGSGLGLSIVKHILDAHNQNIHVKSEIGEGSTFSFTLPKA